MHEHTLCTREHLRDHVSHRYFTRLDVPQHLWENKGHGLQPALRASDADCIVNGRLMNGCTLFRWRVHSSDRSLGQVNESETWRIIGVVLKSSTYCKINDRGNQERCWSGQKSRARAPVNIYWFDPGTSTKLVARMFWRNNTIFIRPLGQSIMKSELKLWHSRLSSSERKS